MNQFFICLSNDYHESFHYYQLKHNLKPALLLNAFIPTLVEGLKHLESFAYGNANAVLSSASISFDEPRALLQSTFYAKEAQDNGLL